jgi:hypothetical protein
VERGIFLYVTLDLLKGLEQEAIARFVDVAGEVQLGLEQINPAQFLGIEINPRAAAIAELVIWIGYLQWYFKRYGNAAPPEPVLQAFGNIECRDAVLAYDGTEPDLDAKTGEVRSRWGGRMMKHPVTGEDVPDARDRVIIYKYLNARAAEWPEADYILGNPPFIGKLYILERLGEGYVKALRTAYKGKVPDSVDLVMYWWEKAAKLTANRHVNKFGFVTTNSINQGFNRRVIDLALTSSKPIYIYFSIPDHPWTNSEDCAAVRISMTVCATGQNKGKLEKVIEEVDSPEDDNFAVKMSHHIGLIHSNLTIGADIVKVKPLCANSKLSGIGVMIGNDGFIVDPKHENLLEKSVIKSITNGRDILSNSRNLKVIDFFGFSLENSRKIAPYSFQQILVKVKPERDLNNRKSRRDNWWLFSETMPKTRDSIKDIKRYILTVLTAKHRVFVFTESEIIPDVSIVAIALDDAYFIGILSSLIHSKWCLASGGSIGSYIGNIRYNKTVCFDPFPFPDSTPEQQQKIRELGDRLDSHRKQVQAAHPDITITGMYNLLEKLRAGTPFSELDSPEERLRQRAYNNRALVSTLKQIHDELDKAVFEAYGWQDLSGKPTAEIDETILERLVTLNAERAAEERNGHIRWLRPEYQAPTQIQSTQIALPGIDVEPETVITPVEQQKWPTLPKAQLAAIRDLLRTSSGEWTVVQIANQFTGKNTQKKLDAIAENLDRLQWFGVVIDREDAGTMYWQYTELQQTA